MSNLRRNNVRLSASVFTLMSLTMLLLYWNAGDRLEISEMKEIGRYRLWNRDLSDHVDYPFWEHPQMDTKVGFMSDNTVLNSLKTHFYLE